jgi:hypothetical protein
MGSAGDTVVKGATETAREVATKTKQALDPRNLFDFDLPDAPEVPEFPEIDSEEDLIRARAIAERIRRAARPGPGRAGTIATSPRGVLTETPITRKVLTGE